MKTLSISVMAHPTREQFFPELKRLLGNDTPFSIDHESRGVWWNCRQSWLLHDPQAEYHVVIQDDAIPCEGFLTHAEEVIRKSGGDKAINFYFGSRGNLKEEADRGLKRGFLLRNSPTWGVAICLRTEWIHEMLEHASHSNLPQDDARIGQYLKHKGITTYFPIPSLVDHRTGAETRSLVGDPGMNRRAFYFIDRQNKK